MKQFVSQLQNHKQRILRSENTAERYVYRSVRERFRNHAKTLYGQALGLL